MEGVKVNNVEALKAQGMNPVAVGETISSLFSNMIFALGLVHCDPVSADWIDVGSMCATRHSPNKKPTRTRSTPATS